MDTGQERNTDEVPSHRGTGGVWSEKEEDSHLLPLGSDGPSWLASRIQTATWIALLERDLQGKLRVALLRKPPTAKRKVVPWDKSLLLYAASIHRTTGQTPRYGAVPQ